MAIPHAKVVSITPYNSKVKDLIHERHMTHIYGCDESGHNNYWGNNFNTLMLKEVAGAS